MKGKSGLRKSLLLVTVIPIVLFGSIIILYCSNQMARSIHQEVESGLKNVAQLALYTYEKEFPGDYHLEKEQNESVVYKGSRKVEEAEDILEQYKKISGTDITIFYHDARIVTTIRDAEGKAIIGTKANYKIKTDVIEEEKECFYTNTKINQEDYFSYYSPLFDSSGACVGMIFAGKPSQYVKKIVSQGVIPVISIIFLCIAVMFIVIWSYADRMIRALQQLSSFFVKVERGNLTTELPSMIQNRKDEIGKIGESAAQMQMALRELIERDALTGLYNRHYGEVWLQEVQQEAQLNRTPFYIIIGDIDFFKKFNDDYGHDCGDMVLREVSGILKRKVSRRGYAARWGGEEFLLVLRGNRVHDITAFVNELAEEIRSNQVIYGEEVLRVTMTFGIADGDSGKHMDELIKCADQALYEGKENGRDQVVYKKK